MGAPPSSSGHVPEHCAGSTPNSKQNKKPIIKGRKQRAEGLPMAPQPLAASLVPHTPRPSAVTTTSPEYVSPLGPGSASLPSCKRAPFIPQILLRSSREPV